MDFQCFKIFVWVDVDDEGSGCSRIIISSHDDIIVGSNVLDLLPTAP
jgi:hypothetical protein